MMLTSRWNVGHEYSAWGVGSGGGGCCFSPVIVGWVGERGGGGYSRRVALDLDIYIYIYIHISLFTYCFWEYRFYSKTGRLFGTHLFPCIMYAFVCIYPNAEEWGQFKFQHETPCPEYALIRWYARQVPYISVLSIYAHPIPRVSPFLAEVCSPLPWSSSQKGTRWCVVQAIDPDQQAEDWAMERGVPRSSCPYLPLPTIGHETWRWYVIHQDVSWYNKTPHGYPPSRGRWIFASGREGGSSAGEGGIRRGRWIVTHQGKKLQHPFRDSLTQRT